MTETRNLEIIRSVLDFEKYILFWKEQVHKEITRVSCLLGKQREIILYNTANLLRDHT